MYKKIILSILFFASVNVSAGIFGASNYEECVLDKMKGQVSQLMFTAQNACRQAFPLPPQEIRLDSEKIKYSWCKTEAKEITYCLEQVPKNIKVTKIEAILFKQKCEDIQTDAGLLVEGEKTLFKDEFKFKTNGKKYLCARAYFYGFEK